MTTRIGYARVSTVNQKTDNQRVKLQAAGCSELFIDDAVSGAKNSRSEQYRALMARVKELREQGEEVKVCVTKLDRFSRSTRDLLEGVEELAGMGAGFEAIDNAFTYEPASAFSELMLTTLGAVATFERSLIVSRMSEGMEAKVSKGLKRGQKPKLNSASVKAIRASYAAEKQSPAKLAKDWGVSRSTIIRVLELPGFQKPYVSLDEWLLAKERANA